MCTVAFVPLPHGGYLLGHNRDERPTRPPGEPPRAMASAHCRALAPRDPEAGGTWIAVNQSGVTVCVLNAAEADPKRLPAQPRSRGLIVRELACAGGAEDVRLWLADARDALAWTRAFHLVVAEPGARVGLFRWDGVEADWEMLQGPALFVSSLLQPHEVGRARRAHWQARAQAGPLDAAMLATFLASHEPARGPLSVCMHRHDAGTVSRTLVEVTKTGAVMRYQAGPPCKGADEVQAGLRLA